MANTKSAEKRARQSLKRRAANRAHTSKLRTAVKQLRSAVSTGDAEQAQALLAKTISAVDATAQKRVIHRNAAARTKSRLTKAVQALAKT
jgi:small subunit ribosomal protein S20